MSKATWMTVVVTAGMYLFVAGTAFANGDPPTAVDDPYSVDRGETLDVDADDGVLANDTDPEDDTLSVISFTFPSRGTLTLDTDDGSFTYEHDGSEADSDSFTYEISDGSSTDDATVTIMITVGEPEDDGDGVKRKGFVGVVANKDSGSFDVVFPDASFETIALPEEYRLKQPGKPGKNQGDFVDGARVAVLAQLLEDESWEAVQVLVKPLGHGSHVVTGAVVGTEDGVVTILLPNGKTKRVKLPAGAGAPQEGEVVTTLVEGPPDTDGEGEEEEGPPAQATGMVRAAEVRERLQRHLDELTVEEGDLPEGKAQARAKRVQRLSELLESHGERHLGILDNALSREKNEKARAAIQNARGRAEEGRQKSQATIERARGRAGLPPKGRPEESRGGPSREFEEDIYIDKQEPGHVVEAGPGPDADTESKSSHLTQGGIRWFAGDPVEYVVIGTQPVDGATAQMIAAFGVIDGFITTRLFVLNGSTTQVNPCTGNPNQVEWGSIDGPGGTIAFAATCRNVATKEIVGFRVKFDSDEDWTIVLGEDAVTDVQNVAVHEFGHVAGLGHVNAPKDGCLTMYRFVEAGETQKRTLGLGDKLGLNALYDTGKTDPGPGCGH